MIWPYERAAWEAALGGSNYHVRQAGLALAGLADEHGLIERESVPRRASVTRHIGVLRDLRLIEALPRGRLRLTMNASPVVIRKAAA